MTGKARINVFISSTCYDLVDLRFELKDHLEKLSFIVRMSDDPSSAFFVDPTVDSIESCLENVERSNVVVCIIDRSYGSPLPDTYQGRSATHVEIDFARQNNISCLYFIRNHALFEFKRLQADSNSEAHWVEKADPERRQLWAAFVREIVELPENGQSSKWRDEFHTVVDLKTKVVNRLLALFPEHATIQALLPERLVRVHFVRPGSHLFFDRVVGHFRNASLQTALDLVHGWRVGDKDTVVGHQGALAHKEDLANENSGTFVYDVPIANNREYRAVFCEYENAFGDRYRVELPFAVRRQMVDLPEVVSPGHGRTGSVASARIVTGTQFALFSERERFFVRGGPPTQPEWIEANRTSYSTVGVPPVPNNDTTNQIGP